VAGRVKLYGRACAFNHTVAHFDEIEPEKKEEIRMVYKLLTNGAYFGEGDIIKRRGRMSKAQALCDCNMYLLSRTVSAGLPKEFENIVVEEFPHIYKKLKDLAKLKDKEDLDKIHRAVKTQFPDLTPKQLDKKIRDLHKVLEEARKTNEAKHELKPLRKMFGQIKEVSIMEEFISIKDSSYKKDGLEIVEESDVQYTDIESEGLEELHGEVEGINRS
jgi:hypothetical protein